MRKKIVAFACAAALAAALPTAAFALDENHNKSAEWSDANLENPVTTGYEGHEVDRYGTYTTPDMGADYYESGTLIVPTGDKVDAFEHTTEHAKNYEQAIKDGTLKEEWLKDVESFKIESADVDAAKGEDIVTLVWFTGSTDNYGLRCRVFVEHADGTTQEKDAGVMYDGTVVVNMDKLSTVTFALFDPEAKNVADREGTANDAWFWEGTPKPIDIFAYGSKDTKATSPKTGGIQL
jgi:hypothetical protein